MKIVDYQLTPEDLKALKRVKATVGADKISFTCQQHARAFGLMYELPHGNNKVIIRGWFDDKINAFRAGLPPADRLQQSCDAPVEAGQESNGV